VLGGTRTHIMRNVLGLVLVRSMNDNTDAAKPSGQTDCLLLSVLYWHA